MPVHRARVKKNTDWLTAIDYSWEKYGFGVMSWYISYNGTYGFWPFVCRIQNMTDKVIIYGGRGGLGIVIVDAFKV